MLLLESVVIHANDTVIITEAWPVDEPGPIILYVNAAFTKMTGYSSEEALGRSPRFLQGPETAREPLDQLRIALENWQPTLVEVLNYRKDGTPFWAEMSVVPIRDKNGWFSHWISIQRDVTERRRAQKALQDAKDEAERANLAKSEFLSRMSHELRTPLNAILGFGQLLEVAELAAEDRESTDQILRGGRHLLTLINEVLDIAQIEAGHLNVSLQSVSMGEVCNEALALVRALANQRGIVLHNYSPLCASFVIADPRRLKQILLNLLSNAVKYNRVDGIVTVECKIVVPGFLRVSVRDEGAGIPEDKQHRLFTPFDRLGVEREGIEGTGVGLALSKGLAEGMNGALGFHSEVGQGSTFWVDMPLDTDSEVKLDRRAKHSLLDLSQMPEGAATSFQVLYIEDNLPNLSLVQRLLRRRPVEMLAAQQGRMGLELARRHHPSLVLMDLHLPDMTGLEVLLALREDPLTRDIPIVILSADASPQQIQRLLDAGAKSYLTKPLNVSEFFYTLDQILV